MVIIAKMNVLSVGRHVEAGCLGDLPIRVVHTCNGIDAVRSFKTEQIDSVISHWHLPDMPDGMFLRKLKAAKPELPTIAIIQANHPQQEIDARVLGVSAVICEDSDWGYFRAVVGDVLGLTQGKPMRKLHAV